MSDEGFIETPEMSKRYNVSSKTLAAWEAQGKLPHSVKLGRKKRWPVSVISDWEASQIAASKGE